MFSLLLGDSMSLQKFCRKPVAKISADANIVAACRMLEEKSVGCLIVESDEKLCGVIADRDIALKVRRAKRSQKTGPDRKTLGMPWTTDGMLSHERSLKRLGSLVISISRMSEIGFPRIARIL
jgi:hypothetical protein